MKIKLGTQNSIRISQKLIFCRQMSSLMKAGIPLLQALDFAAYNQPTLKTHLLTLTKTIHAGHTLAEALTHLPGFLDEFAQQIIQLGELSGTLSQSFSNLTEHFEKIIFFRRKMQKTLTYPCTIMLLGILMAEGMLLYVIPQFKLLFNQLGADLPWLTRCLINLSNFINHYWSGLLFLSMIVGVSIVYMYQRCISFRLWMDQVNFKLPVAGKLFQNILCYRFANHLAVSLNAGLSLDASLKLIISLTSNRLYQYAIYQALVQITQGQKLTQALQSEGSILFSHKFLQMLHLGEETGELELMLRKSAEYYAQAVDDTLDILGRLLEPFTMIILGCLVGGLLLALYLPIIQLGALL